MQKQQGAVLIVVLALLVGAVVIGISAMQSSVVDEHLAGNYRMAAQAQMNAERAAAVAVADNAFFIATTWEDEPNKAWFAGLLEDVRPDWEEKLREESYNALMGLATGVKTSNDTVCDPESGATGAAVLNSCFYFPMTIPDEDGAKRPGDYVVAVGSVKDDAGNPQSSRIVLVEIKPGSDGSAHEGIDPDIAKVFDNYLMASGVNSRVDPAKKGSSGGPNLELNGSLHMLDDKQDFKQSGGGVIVDEEKGYAETRGNENLPDGLKKTGLPKFDLDAFEISARKEPGGAGREVVNSCSHLSGDLKGRVYICSSNDEDEFTDADFSNGTVIFPSQVDFRGKTRLEDVDIVVNGGGNGQVTFEDNLTLDNVKIGAEGEIEYNWEDDKSGTSKIINSYFLSEINVQMNFGDDFELEGGYFYANNESEIAFGNNPDANPCGSIVGVGPDSDNGQAELYVDTIESFSQCDGDGEGSGPSVASWR